MRYPIRSERRCADRQYCLNTVRCKIYLLACDYLEGQSGWQGICPSCDFSTEISVIQSDTTGYRFDSRCPAGYARKRMSDKSVFCRCAMVTGTGADGFPEKYDNLPRDVSYTVFQATKKPRQLGFDTACLFVPFPSLDGGDEGIRTLDTSFGPYAPLAGECLRPLGHISGLPVFSKAVECMMIAGCRLAVNNKWLLLCGFFYRAGRRRGEVCFFVPSLRLAWYRFPARVCIVCR